MMWLPLSHGADVNATDHHGKGDMFPLNYMLYHDRDVVAPALEGRLTRGDEYAERQLQAVGDSLGHDEHIRVEEADGPVARQLVRWLARLEEKLEGCVKDGAESRGGAGVKRLIIIRPVLQSSLLDRRSRHVPANQRPRSPLPTAGM
jgi:hypothetical protein